MIPNGGISQDSGANGLVGQTSYAKMTHQTRRPFRLCQKRLVLIRGGAEV